MMDFLEKMPMVQQQVLFLSDFIKPKFYRGEKMETLLEFKNIEEIKFTRIKNNIFAITINSDIDWNDNYFKGAIFEAKYCKIDSTLEIKMNKEYTNVQIDNDLIVKSETLSIPINIQLLLNRALNNIFTIDNIK